MTEIPPVIRDQGKIDSDHLRLLAIFHFVTAGLALLGIGFLFLHYTMMHAFMANAAVWNGKNAATLPPAEFFGVFKWFYVVMGAWAVVRAVLNVVSGFAIRARRMRIFSLVVSGINCISVPLGTVLGVFTFIVLLRDSVAALYERRALPGAQEAGGVLS